MPPPDSILLLHPILTFIHFITTIIYNSAAQCHLHFLGVNFSTYLFIIFPSKKFFISKHSLLGLNRHNRVSRICTPSPIN